MLLPYELSTKKKNTNYCLLSFMSTVCCRRENKGLLSVSCEVIFNISSNGFALKMFTFLKRFKNMFLQKKIKKKNIPVSFLINKYFVWFQRKAVVQFCLSS